MRCVGKGEHDEDSICEVRGGIGVYVESNYRGMAGKETCRGEHAIVDVLC